MSYCSGYSDAEVGAMIRALGQSQTTAEAVARLEATPQFPVPSTHGIFKALKRRGLGVPSDYLKTDASVVAPVAPTSSFAETVLIVPDTHTPFHDERAFQCMLRAAELVRPTTIVLLGDFLDFYEVSFYSKDPTRTIRLVDEIEAGRRQLDKLDALGARRKVYIMGNHEHRLERYLTEKAPALFGIVDFDKLMKLSETDWELVQYKDHVKIGDIYLTHDVGQHGRNAHVSAGAAYEQSVGIGHVHRLACSYFGSVTGKSHIAASFGWLGDASKIDYLHKAQVLKGWSHGFGVAYVEPDNTTHVNLIPIINYKAVVNGKLVR